MSDLRLSIPRAGSSNLSERATTSLTISIGNIELFAISARFRHRPIRENARGSKLTLCRASGRKVPEKVPDSFPARSLPSHGEAA